MTDLQQDAPSAPPAGWYADPVRPGSTRYWSGTGWTDQVNSPVAEPAVVPLGAYDPGPSAPLGASYDPGPVVPLGFAFEAGPVAEPPPDDVCRSPARSA